MTLRTILVPVRGDGKGEGVLDHALSLAKRYNAHLEVLHCRQQPGDTIYGVMVPEGLRETIRSEEHTSELQSLMRISYAVFCLKKKISYYSRHAAQKNTNL